jgi:hypothetical protein
MKFGRLASTVLVVLAWQAGSSQAEESYFRTPSGNIHCGYMDFDGRPSIRCDISQYTATTPERPADCDLDWGMAFAMEPDGRGQVLCVGDTVITPDAMTLPYGEIFRKAGMTCISEKTGLTCTNGKGHGFFLSKAEQRVF